MLIVVEYFLLSVQAMINIENIAVTFFVTWSNSRDLKWNINGKCVVTAFQLIAMSSQLRLDCRLWMLASMLFIKKCWLKDHHVQPTALRFRAKVRK